MNRDELSRFGNFILERSKTTNRDTVSEDDLNEWQELTFDNTKSKTGYAQSHEEQNAKIEAKLDAFRDVTDPLINFLNENYHPHAKVIITPTSAEIVEGILCYETDDFVRD